MGIYKPSELFSFLKQEGIFAKKHLSQNFLIDGNIISKIVATSVIDKDDLVIEIGPGPGALTEALLQTGAKVICIEKDAVLAKALKRLQTPDQRLEIFENDILTFPMEAFLKKTLSFERRAKVVSNLPYHLTTPIIAHLAPLSSLISSLTLMVQKEVADRFIAKKNTANYSSFTIYLEYFSIPKYCFTIEPTCFHPRPKVRSAVVNLSLFPPKVPVPSSFFKMTRTAFQRRRKMLRSSLKEIYCPTKIEDSLKKLDLNPLARPEQLSLDEFINLFLLLSNYIESDSKIEVSSTS